MSMNFKGDVTVTRLREMLSYDENTGLFNWNISPRHDIKVGDRAGSMSRGYVVIRIDGIRYFAHRLAWLYVNGSFPQSILDHIDGDKSNNRISNLRPADHTINSQNEKKARRNNLSTGLMGAYPFHPRNCFVSYIRFGGKKLNLGYFKTAEGAHQAYLEAKKRLHEGYVE